MRKLLSKGCSDLVRNRNIMSLIQSGISSEKATAIAYKYQRRQGCNIPDKPKHKKRNPCKKKKKIK